MFPGAGAHVYYNEAGEPTGWDTPSFADAPEPDDLDPTAYDDYDEEGVDEDVD